MNVQMCGFSKHRKKTLTFYSQSLSLFFAMPYKVVFL